MEIKVIKIHEYLFVFTSRSFIKGDVTTIKLPLDGNKAILVTE